MTEIAFSDGSTIIYFSSIIIALGTASCFCLIWSLYKANGGKTTVLCLFLLLSTILSITLSRILHWYCHSEQYESFITAVTNYSTGDFVLSGVFIGILISYFVSSLFNANDSRLILDCTAPGLTVLIMLIRISCLFNSSCRSKIKVSNQALQRLPFASAIFDTAGKMEYRFAAFFIEAILLAVLLILLLVFFSKIRNTPAKKGRSNSGGVWLMFILWYSVIEVVMDSTRYDSSFVPFNGFVSVVQTFCGAMMLAVLIYYSIRSVKADGLKLYHWLIWAGWFISLGGAGISEYLVQRHGDWYLSCYFLMSICLVIMAVLTVSVYKYQCNIHSYEETQS